MSMSMSMDVDSANLARFSQEENLDSANLAISSDIQIHKLLKRLTIITHLLDVPVTFIFNIISHLDILSIVKLMITCRRLFQLFIVRKNLGWIAINLNTTSCQLNEGLDISIEHLLHERIQQEISEIIHIICDNINCGLRRIFIRSGIEGDDLISLFTHESRNYIRITQQILARRIRYFLIEFEPLTLNYSNYRTVMRITLSTLLRNSRLIKTNERIETLPQLIDSKLVEIIK